MKSCMIVCTHWHIEGRHQVWKAYTNSFKISLQASLFYYVHVVEKTCMEGNIIWNFSHSNRVLSHNFMEKVGILFISHVHVF